MSLPEWLRAGEQWFKPNDLVVLRERAQQSIAAERAALDARIAQLQAEAEALMDVTPAKPAARAVEIAKRTLGPKPNQHKPKLKLKPSDIAAPRARAPAAESLRQLVLDYVAAHEGSTSEEVFDGIRAIRPQTKNADIQTNLYRSRKAGKVRADGPHGSYRYYFVAEKKGGAE